MQNSIHYALILDQSGSMQDLKDVTISNFNEQVGAIRSLVKKNPECRVKVTLCVFNEAVDLRFIAKDIDQMEKLNSGNYHPESCTALYDAMGITLLHLQEVVNPEEKVLVAVFTDGLENASTQYRGADIAFKLEEAKAKGWNIRFFCYKGDVQFFRKSLRLADAEMNGISLNDSGVRYMRREIHSLLTDIANATDEC